MMDLSLWELQLFGCLIIAIILVFLFVDAKFQSENSALKETISHLQNQINSQHQKFVEQLENVQSENESLQNALKQDLCLERQIVNELVAKCQEEDEQHEQQELKNRTILMTLGLNNIDNNNVLNRSKIRQLTRELRNRAHDLFTEMDLIPENTGQDELADLKIRAKKYNDRAAEITFFKYNCKRDIQTLDLHLLHKSEAVAYLERRLLELSSMNLSRLEVITGRGKHSPDGKSVLKPAMVDYLNRNLIPFEEQQENAGLLEVSVPVNFRGQAQDQQLDSVAGY